ncbi:MAG: hypothetical protein QG559_686 [Campylobacterota bacterium]|jgi:hypothetical protein|nr:hypothetical protein [Campylobacterota bacterium]
MFQDIILVFVMTVPMLLFSVFPGIKLGDYLEEKYNIDERTKRIVVIVSTILFTLTLSLFLHFA